MHGLSPIHSRDLIFGLTPKATFFAPSRTPDMIRTVDLRLAYLRSNVMPLLTFSVVRHGANTRDLNLERPLPRHLQTPSGRLIIDWQDH